LLNIINNAVMLLRAFKRHSKKSLTEQTFTSGVVIAKRLMTLSVHKIKNALVYVVAERGLFVYHRWTFHAFRGNWVLFL